MDPFGARASGASGTSEAAGDRRRVASALSALSLIGLLGLLPILAHNSLSGNWRMVAILAVAWLGLSLAFVLARRGRPEAASLLFFLNGLGLLIASDVLSPLGVYDVGTIGFPMLVVFAGLLLERSASFAAAVLATLATVAALYAATFAGLLPNPVGERLDVGALIDVTVILAVTAAAVRFLRRQFSESVRRARRSERETRVILETSPESIMRFDGEGTVLAANPRAAETLGISVDSLVGRDGIELLVAGDRARGRAELERVLAGETVRDLRLDFRHADGRTVPSEVSAAPLGDPAAGRRGAVVQSRDITARLETESRLGELREQLLQARKTEAIGRLAGGVAHDLNNYLTAIMGFGELARLKAADPAATGADLGRLLEAAERARGVVGQLLAFARRQVLQPRPVRLDEVVASFTRLLRPLIGEHIDLRTELDGTAGTVLVDPSQLEQVIINLAVNARDAMPDGGGLVIATGRASVPQAGGVEDALPAGEYARLEVRDTGAGMGPEALEHLFEPFFTTKPAGRGTGLGLATCQGIVRQSGGEIRVSSVPGQGTTVTVLLPRTEAAASPLPEASAPVARGTETLLVVEDNELVRTATVELLSGQGYRVLAAAGPAAALRAAEEAGGSIALLVTDVVLPGMSGLRLAEEIARRFPGIRVLYTSGHTEPGRLPEEVLRDPRRFLAKPYAPAQLATVVRRVLDAGV